jgi:hypothetical protein
VRPPLFRRSPGIASLVRPQSGAVCATQRGGTAVYHYSDGFRLRFSGRYGLDDNKEVFASFGCARLNGTERGRSAATRPTRGSPMATRSTSTPGCATTSCPKVRRAGTSTAFSWAPGKARRSARSGPLPGPARRRSPTPSTSSGTGSCSWSEMPDARPRAGCSGPRCNRA